MVETPVHAPRRVFFLASTAVFLFATMNVCVKLASSSHSVVEIMFFRSLLALFPVFTLLVMMPEGFSLLKTQRPLAHLSRGLVGVASMACFFWSFSLLPLADATVINFAQPLLLTLMAIPFLKERVGPWRLGAVAVGMVGVLIAVNPSSDMPLLGSSVALLAAIGAATAMILVRRMGNTEHAITIVFYFLLTGTVASGLLLPFYWSPPTMESLAYLMLVGLTGGMAQLFQTKAYAEAPASFVSSFNYLSILFAALFGWLVFGDVPTMALWVGAGIVCASGLLILYREAVLKANVAADNSPFAAQPSAPTNWDKATLQEICVNDNQMASEPARKDEVPL